MINFFAVTVVQPGVWSSCCRLSEKGLSF